MHRAYQYLILPALAAGTFIFSAPLQTDAAITAPKSDKSFESGLALIKKGKYTEARPLIEKASLADPKNSAVRLLLAQLQADGAVAESLYTQVANDISATDSLRAIAYARLGEYWFVKKEFRTSSDAFARSNEFRKDPGIRIERARSLMAAGQPDGACALLEAVIALKKNAFTKKASWLLGECRFGQKDYVKAFGLYGTAIDKCDSCVWYVPALVGRYRCAVALDSAVAIQNLRPEVERVYPRALEAETTADTVVQSTGFTVEDSAPKEPPRKDSVIVSEIPAAAGTDTENAGDDSAAARDTMPSFSGVGPAETYTIQVGSFGTKANANSLAAKLKPDFPEVLVATAEVNDAVYYRVRIGSFVSLEEARNFAAEKFKGRSIRYTIVKR